MIDLYLLSVIIFILFLGIILYLDRKNVRREFVLLLRKTRRGKGFLIKTGNMFPRFWKVVGTFGVILCFLVSVWIFYQFLLITANNLTAEVVPGIGLILPSPSATPSVGPGYFGVPFWYWVIVIGVLALVHEGFHGIMAAREKIRIKSLGWGLLLVIPLAFVEPDEKQLVRKKPWPQLRVFAAGSFANFILAGLTFVIMGLLVFSTFAQAGVAFEGYPARRLHWDNITQINGFNVSGKEDVSEYMDLVCITCVRGFSLTAGSETYYLTAESLADQLNTSEDRVFAYEDYSAVKKNLTDVIIEVNGKAVSNVTQLRSILDGLESGQDVKIVTTNGTVNKSFVLQAKEEPEPVFTPDVNTHVMVSIEHVLPGTIDFTREAYTALVSLLGGEMVENWQTVRSEIKFWEWVGETYPMLRERSGEKLAGLNSKLEGYPRGGFIGISSVYTKLDIKEGLKAFEDPILFVQGLLFWMFLINFGVGAFNLLPIRALDGGRMWEIFLQKIAGSRRARRIINSMSSFILFLIFLNFFLMLKPF